MRKPFEGDYPITQKFGNKFILNGNDVYAQWGLQGHNGIDYRTPTGTVVLAPHAGKILEAAFDANGYGNYVKVENDKEGSVLSHLQEVRVALGTEVKEGDVLGTSDNTGYSTGEHLHWGYYTKPRDHANGFNGYVNQEPILEAFNASPSSVTPPVTGKLYTEEQYNAVLADREKFWRERDEKIKELELKDTELLAARAVLTAFEADGYKLVDDVRAALAPYKEIQAHSLNTYDDIQKVLKERDEQISGLNKELLQVLDRNQVMLDQLAKKENEDYTAIQAGVKALEELKQIKDKMTAIHKTVGITPEKGYAGFMNLIQSIKDLRKWAEKAVAQAKKEKETTPKSEAVVPPVETATKEEVVKEASTGIKWIMKTLGFSVGLFAGVLLPRLLNIV